MAKFKSVVLRVTIETAGNSHNCQHDRRHRIMKGDTRLKVWSEDGKENFCAECGLAMLQEGIVRLTDFSQRLCKQSQT